MVASPTSRRELPLRISDTVFDSALILTSENGKLYHRNPTVDQFILGEADKRNSITDDLQATVMELLAFYCELKRSQ